MSKSRIDTPDLSGPKQLSDPYPIWDSSIRGYNGWWSAWVECVLCGRPTRIVGTQLCDSCNRCPHTGGTCPPYCVSELGGCGADNGNYDDAA